MKKVTVICDGQNFVGLAEAKAAEKLQKVLDEEGGDEWVVFSSYLTPAPDTFVKLRKRDISSIMIKHVSDIAVAHNIPFAPGGHA